MFNIMHTLSFFIVTAIAIILNFEKCKADTNLVKLDVLRGTEIDIKLEGNPSTGFMWYILSLTKEMPKNVTLSYTMLKEISKEDQNKKMVTGEVTDVIVSPLHTEIKEGIMDHLIGSGSTFDNKITVYTPGTYYVKYVYVKASRPPEATCEIILEINVESTSGPEKEDKSEAEKKDKSEAEKKDKSEAEKKDKSEAEKENKSAAEKQSNYVEEKENDSAKEGNNSGTEKENIPAAVIEKSSATEEENGLLHLDVAIETKMCTVGKSAHVTMKGNPSLGNLWYVYDVVENAAELKTLYQKIPPPNQNKEVNILVTDPSCENISLPSSSMVGESCTFGSVITPKKTGTYYVVYSYKHFSSLFVKKYKFVKVNVF